MNELPKNHAGLEYAIDPQKHYRLEDLPTVVRPQFLDAARFLARSALTRPEDYDGEGRISGKFLQQVESDYAPRLVVLKRFYEDFKKAVCIDDELSWNGFKKIMDEEGVGDIYLQNVKDKKLGRFTVYLLKQGKTVQDLANAMWVAYQSRELKNIEKKSVEPLDTFVDPKKALEYVKEVQDGGGTIVLFQQGRYRNKQYRALIEAARDLWPYAFTQIGAEGLRQLETAVLDHLVKREIDAISRDGDRNLKKEGAEIVREIRERLEQKYKIALPALAVDETEVPPRELEARLGRERAGQGAKPTRRSSTSVEDDPDDEEDTEEDDGAFDDDEEEDDENGDHEDDRERNHDDDGPAGQHPLDQPSRQPAPAAQEAPKKREGETNEERRARLKAQADKLSLMRGAGRRR